MIPLDEARSHVLDRVPLLHPKGVALADALGCATSVAVSAPEAVPPFDNTAVDGFAVRALDVAAVPVELAVLGTIAAGAPPDLAVAPGACVRVMTGAGIPPGADAVVMVEDTEPLGAERVRIMRSVGAGDAVRRAGSDVAAGAEVLPSRTELTAAHLGVLAMLGFRRAPVYPRPRVGVLSTGDELVEDGSELRAGQIRESNRPMLLAAVRAAGWDAVDLGLAPDDRGAIAEALERGRATCDAILTSGGVSMGEFDLVRRVLDEVGDMRWMQIAIKPAKPFAFGVLPAVRDGFPVPVFGLPGNPVSSLVSFELLARPAIRKMAGHLAIDRPTVLAVADEPLSRRADGKTHFARVHARFGADGRVHVRLTGEQGSHQLASTAAAGGLAELPDGDGVPQGGEVTVRLIATPS